MSQDTLTLEAPQAALLRNLWLGNLAVFALLVGGAFILAPWFSAMSVAVGGLVALANFRLLQRTIIRALLPATPRGVMGVVLFKYYLRFAATAALLWVLVRQGWVEPLGLLVGLSVVVLSIITCVALQAHRMIKEAG